MKLIDELKLDGITDEQIEAMSEENAKDYGFWLKVVLGKIKKIPPKVGLFKLRDLRWRLWKVGTNQDDYGAYDDKYQHSSREIAEERAISNEAFN